MITNLAVLGFDEATKRMRLESLHPGVSLQAVLDNTEFPLLISDPVPQTTPPTPEQLALLRRIDPAGVYINKLPKKG